MDTASFEKKKRNHFRRNRSKYFAGGICLIVGSLIGMYASRVKRQPVEVEPVRPQLVEDILGNDIIKHIGRNGHPGNVIYCNETKQVFRSHREATRELGINSRDLWEYLKGLKGNARGYTFKKLGEANKALYDDTLL
jgi:hypothetical protein